MNILLIITDQQSNRALSCTGNPWLNTPHMDALAASGTRFTESYCASPVCGPSRACIATGRMPHENGVLVNGMSIHDDMPTMGEIFRDAGYRTAWTGRWCVPGNGPDIRGFDCLHEISQPLGRGIYADNHVADCAIDFLEKDHNQPFLLGVSLCNPHDICYWVMQQSIPEGVVDGEMERLKQTADSLDFGFDPSESDLPLLPDNFAIDPLEPAFISKCRKRRHYGQEPAFTWDWDDLTWRRYLYAYYRLTERVDVQIGRVMSALADSGLQEDTLVVLSSDHGEGMAGHHWVVKLGLYEEPMRVPLIFSSPGSLPEQVDTTSLTSGIDILPTVCDYAEVDCPPVTGTTLRPVISDPRWVVRDALVAQLHPDTKNLEMQGRMLRTQRYKYTAFSEGTNPEQLFDLQEDPGETTNLALGDSHSDLTHDHRQMLTEALAQSADHFEVPSTV